MEKAEIIHSLGESRPEQAEVYEKLLKSQPDGKFLLPVGGALLASSQRADIHFGPMQYMNRRLRGKNE